MKSNQLITGLLFIFSMACLAKPADIPLLSIKGANWSSEELAYIKQLNQKGSINIATKISSAVYLPNKDGSIAGFHYSVLKEFATLANISIEVKLVTWNDYFYKAGEDLEKAKVDPNYSYVPTLIENVDLYLDGITVLPWRSRMFNIIKYVPSRQMIVSRHDNKPDNISALNNMTYVMVANTSMQQNLNKLAHTHNLKLSRLSIKDFDLMDKMVSQGKADFTVYDSDRAFAAMANYANLTISWPISEPQIMGWAVNKKNKLLQGILNKYIKYAQQNGILDKYWKRSYGVTFIQYLKVINLGMTKH
jgi:membrane-bound lytic murein transglycosylase MltF